MLTLAYVGVGSNLGDRKHTIHEAERRLASNPEIHFLRSAPLYETDPLGGPPQGRYLNTVWELETALNAQEFMTLLLSVESHLGRKRFERNGPRSIDLDLLFFGDQVIREETLTVPHPRLHERWFVLKPLWDLRSDLIHPVFKKSVCELLDEVNESSQKSE